MKTHGNRSFASDKRVISFGFHLLRWALPLNIEWDPNWRAIKIFVGPLWLCVRSTKYDPK